MTRLIALHTDIDHRVNTVRDSHPDWLCRRGCDQCCRRLAAIPSLSAEEWDWLKQGLHVLPAEQQQRIADNIRALAQHAQRPITCPMLDPTNGACPVYLHRPIACRTYGFYVQRDKGLYCKEIEAQVEQGQLDNVVWGNHDAIDQQLETMGEMRLLTEWFLG